MSAAEQPIKAYAPIRKEVDQAKSETPSFDYEDIDGNKAARSHVYALRLLKGKVEAARKDGKAASLAFGRRVDAEAKEIIADIESLIEVHAKPLQAIENREKSRIESLKSRLLWFYDSSSANDSEGDPFGSNYLLSKLAEVRAIPLDESWDEFLAEAGQAKDKAVSLLERHAAAAKKHEEESAELQRLREAQAKADAQAERKRIEEAAAAKVKANAERAAQAEREAHAKALQDAESKAQRERDESAKALRDQQEAAEKRELEMKLEAERKERKRREAEDAARQAKEARERDEANRAKIHDDIAAYLIKRGVTAKQATIVVGELSSGNVPHVSINY